MTPLVPGTKIPDHRQVRCPPSPEVIGAFGAVGEPRRLSGGQGQSWRVGDVVLKPLDMSLAELTWQATVLAAVADAGAGIRVAVPRRSRGGELIVGGWTATPWLNGQHRPNWPEIIDAGNRFHDALRHGDAPSELLAGRTDHWARADRVAWGESAADQVEQTPLARRLLDARGEISAASQLIHGDLSGNVLFADNEPPAIIDLSPYWRPKAYATAIVVVDAVIWNGEPLDVLESVHAEPEGDQMLIRALIFRLLSDLSAAGDFSAYERASRYLSLS